MCRERSPDFDALEGRKLLSGAHHAVAHPAPAVAAAPLAIDGTLTVQNKSAKSTSDSYGDTTTATPVVGVLGGLGKVKGTWIKDVGSDGSPIDPDTIRFRTAQGTVVVAFNMATVGKGHRAPGGGMAYQLAQHVRVGTGGYAGSRESGTIELTTNPAKTEVTTLSLSG